MPFIKRMDRVKFTNVLLEMPRLDTKGELEFCVYHLMNHYMKNLNPNYSNLHDTVYAVIHAAEEWKRKNLDPYEDTKAQENGEIF